VNGAAAPAPRRVLTWQTLLLAGVIVLFGTASDFPLGVLVGLAGFAGAAVLRYLDRPSATVVAFVPLVTALALVATLSAANAADDLLAGLTSLGVLVWISDEPTHPVGGTGRGAKLFLLSTLTLSVAWVASLLRISVVGGIGLAVGLIALALLLVASLLARLPPADANRPHQGPEADLDSTLNAG
jgi:hypothetical protein